MKHKESAFFRQSSKSVAQLLVYMSCVLDRPLSDAPISTKHEAGGHARSTNALAPSLPRTTKLPIMPVYVRGLSKCCLLIKKKIFMVFS